jgi:CHAT domain-containing protein
MQRGVVILSGANRTNLSEQEEGYLTAAETSLLKLEGTRLATLSACDTGKGTIEVGDGVYGLRRALAVAGAQSSLLSLWKVDDRATMAFMKHFYEAIAKGETPEKALKSAQVFMRSHERIEWRNPYAWAAFQLYGQSW